MVNLVHRLTTLWLILKHGSLIILAIYTDDMACKLSVTSYGKWSIN